MKITLLAIALCCAAAGCASPETSASNERYEAPDYSTGSNLPRKKGSAGPTEVKTIDPNSIETMGTRGGGSPGRTGP